MDKTTNRNPRRRLTYKNVEEQFKITPYKLDIGVDLAAIDSLLEDNKVEAEPVARALLLDMVYSIFHQKLSDAREFSKARKKSEIGDEDLEMAMHDNDEGYEFLHGPIPSRNSSWLSSTHHFGPTQDMAAAAEAMESYSLAPMRNSSQAGTKVELPLEGEMSS